MATVTKFLNLAKAQGMVPETVREHYAVLTHTAAECSAYGACEQRCPFGVMVRDNMQQAQEIFGHLEIKQMNITKMSKKYGLTPDTLRYYERIGHIPKVGITPGGIRKYGEEDCRWIEFIKYMRNAGLTVDTLIEYVALFQQGDVTIEARKALLIEQRQQLAGKIMDMQQTLERLSGKIERYEKTLIPVENELKKPRR